MGVIALLFGISGFAAVLFLAGHRLIRPEQHPIGDPPATLQAQSLRLPTDSGGHVAGWFSAGRPGMGAVLLLHGVRGDRLAMLERALFLHRDGFSTLLIDLPAHGESSGEWITFGKQEGAGVRAALAYLAQRLPDERVGVIAVSLGAAATVLANPQSAPAALVLESMYPTIEEALKDRLALHLGAWGRALSPLLLCQLPWRTGVSAAELRPIDQIGQLHSPLLLVSGAEDRHTTLAETERLFAAAVEPKALWIVGGAAHVDLHDIDRAAYEARVGGFLAEQLRRR
jgi:alpha-beta hydrolase superfamily lysophospholipase